jgi:hypothetical protein
MKFDDGRSADWVPPANVITKDAYILFFRRESATPRTLANLKLTDVRCDDVDGMQVDSELALKERLAKLSLDIAADDEPMVAADVMQRALVQAGDDEERAVNLIKTDGCAELLVSIAIFQTQNHLYLTLKHATQRSDRRGVAVTPRAFAAGAACLPFSPRNLAPVLEKTTTIIAPCVRNNIPAVLHCHAIQASAAAPAAAFMSQLRRLRPAITCMGN